MMMIPSDIRDIREALETALAMAWQIVANHVMPEDLAEARGHFDRASEWLAKPFAHRNGETEPPTENGWYGFRGEHRNAMFNGKWRERGIQESSFCLVDGDEDYRFVWVADDDQPIDDFDGRWWGPIVPPWEAS